MKQLTVSVFAIALLLSLFTGCRPPEIEGARVHLQYERYDVALVEAIKATEKYPNNSEAWYLKGSILGKNGDYVGLTESFDKSLSIDQKFANDIDRERLYYFQTVYNIAVAKYNSFTGEADRTTEAAKEHLKKAVSGFEDANLLKEDYAAVSLSALCYSLLEDDESALEKFKLMTTMKPDTADGWISLGQYYYNNKDYDSSVVNLEKAIEIDPKNVDAIAILSQVYGQMGNREKALSYYSRAVDLVPDEKVYPFNLGLMYFQMSTEEGVTDEEKMRYLQGCADNMTKVLNLDSEMKDAYDLKGNSFILLEKYEDAKLILKQAIDYYPDEYNFWFNLGVAHSRLQEVDDAKKAFDRAEQLQE